MLRFILRQLPESVRASVRNGLDYLDGQVRFLLLRYEIRRLRSNPSRALDARRLSRLRNLWGNAGFTADIDFLGAVVERLTTLRGNVLDCGSGLTTVLAAALGSQRDVTIWSLEQEGEWFHTMQSILSRLRLQNVRLHHTPLRLFDGYAWYDADSVDLPTNLSLVICDGPAVFEQAHSESIVEAWRSGLVPYMNTRGITFREIVLDDGDDHRAALLMERWHRAGLQSTVVSTPNGKLVLARPRLPH